MGLDWESERRDSPR